MAKISIDDQLAEAKRELALRENVYPKWVADNRMKAADAQRFTDRQRAIVATLEFHSKYREAFKRLAVELLTAERSETVAAARGAIPGTEVKDVRDTA